MANRRKDRPVPEGFSKWDGNYQKQLYIVITWNNVVYNRCWPNAGTFHDMTSGKVLQGSEVFAIKPSDEQI